MAIIYLEVSKEAGMATDEQGQPSEIYCKIDVGKVNPKWRENMIAKLGETAILQLAAGLTTFDQGHLREITQEEYENNVE